MSLFYTMRPSEEPIGWQGRKPTRQYTRFGPLRQQRTRAIEAARRVNGRAYEYDGERRLIYDAAQPDNVRDIAYDVVGEHPR